MNQIDKLIIEINQSFNDLGEDLVLLESVLHATEGKHDFPQEYVVTGLKRMEEYINQHTGDIKQLSGYVVAEAAAARQSAPGVPKANQVGTAGHILKETLRPIHGMRSGLARTDYRTSAKNKRDIECHPPGDAPKGILKP